MAFLAIPEIIEGAEFTMAELLPTIRNAIQRIPEIKQSINKQINHVKQIAQAISSKPNAQESTPDLTLNETSKEIQQETSKEIQQETSKEIQPETQSNTISMILQHAQMYEQQLQYFQSQLNKANSLYSQSNNFKFSRPK